MFYNSVLNQQSKSYEILSYTKIPIHYSPRISLINFSLSTPSLISDDEELGDIRYDEKRTQDELINKCNYNDNNFIHERLSSQQSLLTRNTSTGFAYNSSHSTDYNINSMHHRGSYPMMLQLITQSLVGSSQLSQIYEQDNEGTNDTDGDSSQSNVPSMNDILQQVEKQEGTKLDDKQILTYRSICATFLLGLIQDGINDKTLLGRYFTAIATNTDVATSTNNLTKLLKTKLMAIGGRYQLIMFLTGPAGAGKTTAIKMAEKFCFQFCRSVSIMWNDNTFLFTAYTGSAASAFGGVTTCSAAFLNKKNEISDEDKKVWLGVRIVVIDEISFMKASEVEKLNTNLQLIGDSNKLFGGFSIIFAGDFRQLEPPGAKNEDLLFSRASGCGFENKLNAVIFLENKHRFKKDPRYGEMLKKFWEGNIDKADRKWINERYVGRNGAGLKLPKSNEFEDVDVVYAAPTNRERNAITAGNFRHHVQNNCPHVNTPDHVLPPDHTIIIEADILSSAPKQDKRYNKKVGGAMRHRIYTSCGDADCKAGTKHIDPALCLYMGTHLICTIGNENLRDDVPRGNGTLCRLVGVKLKPGRLRQWKNYYDRKVWTICASDVEWIECEHYPTSRSIIELQNELESKREQLSEICSNLHCTQNDTTEFRTTQKRLRDRIEFINNKLLQEKQKHTFRLETKTTGVKVRVKPHALAPEIDFKCKMTQFPVNCNDATTGHKLQGMSKDVVIITSWPNGFFKNWEYVVLSRVRTHDGLYLFEKISMDKDFSPSEELSLFFQRARSKEQGFYNENENYLKQFKSMVKHNSRGEIL
jgi:hypothetical protein